MISALATFWMAGNILAAGAKTTTTDIFCDRHVMLTLVCVRACVRAQRPGLVGDPQNLDAFVGGPTELPELASVRGALLRP